MLKTSLGIYSLEKFDDTNFICQKMSNIYVQTYMYTCIYICVCVCLHTYYVSLKKKKSKNFPMLTLILSFPADCVLSCSWSLFRNDSFCLGSLAPSCCTTKKKAITILAHSLKNQYQWKFFYLQKVSVCKAFKPPKEIGISSKRLCKVY